MQTLTPERRDQSTTIPAEIDGAEGKGGCWTKRDTPSSDRPALTLGSEPGVDGDGFSAPGGEVIPLPGVFIEANPSSATRSGGPFPGSRPDSRSGISLGSNLIARARALGNEVKGNRIVEKQGRIQKFLGEAELRESRQKGGVLPQSMTPIVPVSEAPALAISRGAVPEVVAPVEVGSGSSTLSPTLHEVVNLDAPEEEPLAPVAVVPIILTAPVQEEPVQAAPEHVEEPQSLAEEVPPQQEEPVAPKPKEYATTPNYAEVARVLMSRLFVAENPSDPSSSQCFNKGLYQALSAVFLSVAGLEIGRVRDVNAIPCEVSKLPEPDLGLKPCSDTRLEGVAYDDDEDGLTGYGPFICVTQNTVSILDDDKETSLVSVRFEPIIDREKLGFVKILITPKGFNTPFQCRYVIDRWKGGQNDGKAKMARFVVDEREFPAPPYHDPNCYEGKFEMLGIIRELVLRIVSLIPQGRLHKFTPGVMLEPIFPAKDVEAYRQHPFDVIPSTADWNVLGQEIPYTCVARALGELLFEESEAVDGAPAEVKFSSEVFGRLFGPFFRLKKEAATGTAKISVEIPERNPWVTVDFSLTNNGARIAFRLFGLEDQPFLCEIDRTTFRVFSQQFPLHPRHGYSDYLGKVEMVVLLRELVLRVASMAQICGYPIEEFSPGAMGDIFDSSTYENYKESLATAAPRFLNRATLGRALRALTPVEGPSRSSLVSPLALPPEVGALQEAGPENPSHVEAFFVSQQLDAGLSDKAWENLLREKLMPDAKRFVGARCQPRGFDAGLVRLATEVTASLPPTEAGGRVDLQAFESSFNARLVQLEHGPKLWRRLVSEVEKKVPAELRLTLNVDGCGDKGRFLDVGVCITEDGTVARVIVYNRFFPVAQADRTSIKNVWVQALGSLKAALREKVCKVEFCMGADSSADVARIGRIAITPKLLQQWSEGSEVETMLAWSRIEDRFTLRQPLPPPTEEVGVDAPPLAEPVSAEPVVEGEVVGDVSDALVSDDSIEGVVDQAGSPESDRPPPVELTREEVAPIGVVAPVDQGVVTTRRGLGSLFRGLFGLGRKSG